MARKSRKQAIQAVLEGGVLPAEEPQVRETLLWNACAYARLSVLETRDRKDSEALTNQKALLRNFIASQDDLKLCEVYFDNGETGTNFERAGFQRMMEDVQTGKINCIVVKDLSRLGRNCVETGNYLERVFPFLGVRFIAVTDGYDSAAANAGDVLAAALKNLVNEAYSLDISRKSGAILREKQQRGEFIGAFAAYGYLRDPEDTHRLAIDPEAAPIVQEIFRRKAAGESDAAIVRWLNNAGVLPPNLYRYQKGITLDKRYADGKQRLWVTSTIKGILRNQVYLGHLVQGRRRSELYAGIPDRRVPESEWVVVEHTHEAIVDQETFDRVQQIWQDRRTAYHAACAKRGQAETSENLFLKLVFCSDCGRPMVRYKQLSRDRKSAYYHYMCPRYAMYLEQSGCAYKYLPEEALTEAVSRLIAQEAALAADTSALMEKQAPAEDQGLAREIMQLQGKQNKLKALRERLVRDLLADLLSKEDHDRLKEKYSQEARQLQARLDGLLAEQARARRLLTRRNPWLAAFQKHSGQVSLTRELVLALVDRVVVFPENRIEIHLKYRDERAALLEAAAGWREAEA